MKTNLKKETLAKLKYYGKTIKDIEWIGNSDGTIFVSVDDFLVVANKEYNAGFGSNEVNGDLVVAGKDWWLERWEYDGSEGWAFKSLPKLKPNYKVGTNIFVENFDDNWGLLDNLTLVEHEAKKKGLI